MSRFIIVLIFIFIYYLPARAQSNYLYIDSISVYGNKTTKSSTIFREMHLQVGDSILQTDLMAQLKKNEAHLLNTSLLEILMCGG
jgi:cell division septal protein FtsQ